jgi:hypothetical protein
MIFENPPDRLLRAADVIALFDLNVPGWHEMLVNAIGHQPMSPKDFMIVDIPVDSGDSYAIQQWRDRVTAVRK